MNYVYPACAVTRAMARELACENITMEVNSLEAIPPMSEEVITFTKEDDCLPSGDTFNLLLMNLRCVPLQVILIGPVKLVIPN